MKKILAAAAIGSMVCAGAASAASVKSLEGSMFVSQGASYNPTSVGATLLPGDRVMVSNNSKGVIAFSDGCQFELVPGKVLLVHKSSPCADPSRVSERKPDLPGRMSQSGPPPVPFSPLIIGGLAVGTAVAVGVVVSQQNKDDKKSP
jgi:hypothetical protein